MSDQPKPTGDVGARITEYLVAGGLFNPEMMEHEKVRDLLMDCRAALAAEWEKTDTWRQAHARLQEENLRLKQQLAAEYQ